MLRASFITTIGGDAPGDGTLPAASGVSFHTGRLRAGQAFFALPGAAHHGLEFADAALERGAAFIVSDRPHPRGVVVSDPAQTLLALGKWSRRAFGGRVVGITGSAGKTSTRAFVAAALAAPSSPGNLNTPLALAAILTNVYQATPNAPALVLELGIDHPGEMAQLLELVAPDYGVLTLVAPSHLKELGSVAGVAREKGLLIAATEGLASRQAAEVLAEHTDITPSATYDLEPGSADYTGHTVAQGTEQTLHYRDVSVTLGYPGRAMALNALAALALADKLGVAPEVAAKRLAGVSLEPGRLEAKRIGGALVLDDSYNSNPASARGALDVLRGLPRPHTAILGDMLELGPDSPEYHRALGAATLGLDRVIAIGEAAAGLRRGNPATEHFLSFGEALPTLSDLPLEGTILLKASRGVRLERVMEVLSKTGTEVFP